MTFNRREFLKISALAGGGFAIGFTLPASQAFAADTKKAFVAQMEGGMVYGLSAALYGEITLKDGKVEQSNFNDYPVVRMNEMPVVEVHLVKSAENPGGVGEPGTPPIAPAVANALFALTGKRHRTLPLSQSLKT